eukprot:Clim_evm40s33 gene=Clim_evmTU40s33
MTVQPELNGHNDGLCMIHDIPLTEFGSKDDLVASLTTFNDALLGAVKRADGSTEGLEPSRSDGVLCCQPFAALRYIADGYAKIIDKSDFKLEEVQQINRNLQVVLTVFAANAQNSTVWQGLLPAVMAIFQFASSHLFGVNRRTGNDSPDEYTYARPSRKEFTATQMYLSNVEHFGEAGGYDAIIDILDKFWDQVASSTHITGVYQSPTNGGSDKPNTPERGRHPSRAFSPGRKRTSSTAMSCPFTANDVCDLTQIFYELRHYLNSDHREAFFIALFPRTLELMACLEPEEVRKQWSGTIARYFLMIDNCLELAPSVPRQYAEKVVLLCKMYLSRSFLFSTSLGENLKALGMMTEYVNAYFTIVPATPRSREVFKERLLGFTKMKSPRETSEPTVRTMRKGSEGFLNQMSALETSEYLRTWLQTESFDELLLRPLHPEYVSELGKLLLVFSDRNVLMDGILTSILSRSIDQHSSIRKALYDLAGHVSQKATKDAISRAMGFVESSGSRERDVRWVELAKTLAVNALLRGLEEPFQRGATILFHTLKESAGLNNPLSDAAHNACMIIAVEVPDDLKLKIVEYCVEVIASGNGEIPAMSILLKMLKNAPNNRWTRRRPNLTDFLDRLSELHILNVLMNGLKNQEKLESDAAKNAKVRFEFLDMYLCNCSQVLTKTQVFALWDYYTSPTAEVEATNTALRWFLSIHVGSKRSSAFELDTAMNLFTDRICQFSKMEVCNLRFAIFQRYFFIINRYKGKVDFEEKTVRKLTKKDSDASPEGTERGSLEVQGSTNSQQGPGYVNPYKGGYLVNSLSKYRSLDVEQDTTINNQEEDNDPSVWFSETLTDDVSLYVLDFNSIVGLDAVWRIFGKCKDASVSALAEQLAIDLLKRISPGVKPKVVVESHRHFQSITQKHLVKAIESDAGEQQIVHLLRIIQKVSEWYAHNRILTHPKKASKVKSPSTQFSSLKNVRPHSLASDRPRGSGSSATPEITVPCTCKIAGQPEEAVILRLSPVATVHQLYWAVRSAAALPQSAPIKIYVGDRPIPESKRFKSISKYGVDDNVTVTVVNREQKSRFFKLRRHGKSSGTTSTGVPEISTDVSINSEGDSLERSKFGMLKVALRSNSNRSNGALHEDDDNATPLEWQILYANGLYERLHELLSDKSLAVACAAWTILDQVPVPYHIGQQVVEMVREQGSNGNGHHDGVNVIPLPKEDGDSNPFLDLYNTRILRLKLCGQDKDTQDYFIDGPQASENLSGTDQIQEELRCASLLDKFIAMCHRRDEASIRDTGDETELIVDMLVLESTLDLVCSLFLRPCHGVIKSSLKHPDETIQGCQITCRELIPDDTVHKAFEGRATVLSTAIMAMLAAISNMSLHNRENAFILIQNKDLVDRKQHLFCDGFSMLMVMWRFQSHLLDEVTGEEKFAKWMTRIVLSSEDDVTRQWSAQALGDILLGAWPEHATPSKLYIEQSTLLRNALGVRVLKMSCGISESLTKARPYLSLLRRYIQLLPPPDFENFREEIVRVYADLIPPLLNFDLSLLADHQEGGLTNVFVALCEAISSILDRDRTLVHDVKFETEIGGSLMQKIIFFAVPNSEESTERTANWLHPKSAIQASLDLCLRLVRQDDSESAVVKNIFHAIMDEQFASSSGRWIIRPEAEVLGTTGRVGLRNLGSTCYMNSVYQQLFAIPAIRGDVLRSWDIDITQIPAEDDENNTRTELQRMQQTMTGQLQRLFSFLSFSYARAFDPIMICSLLRDFDGNKLNVMQQMDAQEFLNMFIDRLEREGQKSGSSDIWREHIGGYYLQEILSQDCGHVSTTTEPFYTLGLEIQDLNDITDSLASLIQSETLDGPNKYFCDKCEKRTVAVKRTVLGSNPRHLVIHLKRFAFDLRSLTNTKVDSYCRFPHTLDLEPYMHKSVLLDPKRSGGFEYQLKGVVVHQGNIDAGHYFSVLCDRETGEWFEYNDEDVLPFDTSMIPELCFGGQMMDENGEQFPKNFSAYLLVYDRKDIEDNASENESVDVLQMRSSTIMDDAMNVIQRKNKSLVRNLQLFHPAIEKFLMQWYHSMEVQSTIKECPKRAGEVARTIVRYMLEVLYRSDKVTDEQLNHWKTALLGLSVHTTVIMEYFADKDFFAEMFQFEGTKRVQPDVVEITKTMLRTLCLKEEEISVGPEERARVLEKCTETLITLAKRSVDVPDTGNFVYCLLAIVVQHQPTVMKRIQDEHLDECVFKQLQEAFEAARSDQIDAKNGKFGNMTNLINMQGIILFALNVARNLLEMGEKENMPEFTFVQCWTVVSQGISLVAAPQYMNTVLLKDPGQSRACTTALANELIKATTDAEFNRLYQTAEHLIEKVSPSNATFVTMFLDGCLAVIEKANMRKATFAFLQFLNNAKIVPGMAEWVGAHTTEIRSAAKKQCLNADAQVHRFEDAK